MSTKQGPGWSAIWNAIDAYVIECGGTPAVDMSGKANEGRRNSSKAIDAAVLAAIQAWICRQPSEQSSHAAMST